MERKPTAGLGFVCGVLLALLVGLQIQPSTAQQRGDLVERVLDHIERSHVNQVDGTELLHEGLDQMLRSLDRNSAYYSPGQVAAFKQGTDGYIVGIGIVIGPPEPSDAENRAPSPFPRITAVVNGGPAARAGLSAGDQLLAAAGVSLRALDVDQVTALIKGPEGTEVELEIEKLTGEKQIVLIPRERVQISSIGEVALYQPKEGRPVGFVRLVQFQPDTTSQVEIVISQLLESGADSIVLDLRGNGGGLLTEAIGVASLFLPEETLIVRRVGREPSSRGTTNPGVREQLSVSTGPSPFLDVALAILIDGNSASASEIVAAALRDHRRALLIGEESYGKWTVQDVIPLGPNARDGIVKITTQRFHSPTGGRIRWEDDSPRGLVPDISIAVDPELRLLQQRRWYQRQLDRINGPLDVDEPPLPTADAPLENTPPPDPIGSRAIDLLSRNRSLDRLFASDQLEVTSPSHEPVEQLVPALEEQNR